MSSPAQLWQYRTLISNLTRRDLKAKYRKSLLGQLWSLLSPAATLGTYTLVFGVIFETHAPIAGNGTTESFALYLFAALIIWNFFSAGVSASIDGLQGAGPLLNKIYFPPEGPVLAVVFGVIVQLGFELTVLILIMGIVGNLSWTFFLFPVVLLVPIVAFALGCGLIASILNIFYRDVRYLIGILLQLAFYMTPIVYKIEQIPEKFHGFPARRVVNLNPLARFVDASRELFYLHTVPSFSSIAYMWIVSLAMFGIGWRFFTKRAAQAVEEL
ncbi:MAG: ABC transporter permease [Acidimicrobiales bacterium]